MHQIEVVVANLLVLVDLELHVGAGVVLGLSQVFDLFPLIVQQRCLVLDFSFLLVELSLRFVSVLL